MRLPTRLAMNVYSDFTIPAFGRHVTVLLFCEYESQAFSSVTMLWIYSYIKNEWIFVLEFEKTITLSFCTGILLN
jgi:hypothetical protein